MTVLRLKRRPLVDEITSVALAAGKLEPLLGPSSSLSTPGHGLLELILDEEEAVLILFVTVESSSVVGDVELEMSFVCRWLLLRSGC